MSCERAEKCGFLAYCEETGKKSAAKGFATMFCEGDKSEDCKRLKVCHELGADKVPKNMLPTGMPISGTTKDGWSDKVMEIIKRR